MQVPDHRRIGRELGIYANDELCGTGLPLWLPAGAVVRGEIERYVVDLERRHGYQHVYTPELAKRELYERSDHWAHYHEDMYPPMRVGADEVLLRPMNCPHHVLVFAAEPKSARDIPYRLAELGTMFRMERSGVVGGLARVRQMTLNDAHIFCAPEQVDGEIAEILGLVDEAYHTLGIPVPTFRLSLSGSGSKYVGDPALWDVSESMLRSALVDLGLSFEEARGEAAFYGPKIDLQVADPRGREQTLSTVQLDFHLPARFDLSFQRGPARERPVMIHRSIVSSLERMVAHLLEVHDGALPVWLSPTQITVLPIATDAVPYAQTCRDLLRGAGLRVEVYDREATLGARIRAAERRHVPFLAVVGRREVEDQTISVRLRTRRQLEPQTVADFARTVNEAIARRSLDGG